MKRVAGIVAVVIFTAVYTWLSVTKYFTDEQNDRLKRQLREAEVHVAALEEEIDAAKRRVALLAREQQSGSGSELRHGRPPGGPLASIQTTPEVYDDPPVLLPIEMERGERAENPPPAELFAPALRFVSLPWNEGNLLRVDGKASAYDWRVESHALSGTAAFNASSFKSFMHAATPPSISADIRISVPVSTLQTAAWSGNLSGDDMNELVQETMREQAYPNLEFTLDRLTKNSVGSGLGPAFYYTGYGQIAFAGATNRSFVRATLWGEPGGALLVCGYAQLKMSDFKIRPPSIPLKERKVPLDDNLRVSLVWRVRPNSNF